MGRRRRPRTFEDIDTLVKAGRGQGEYEKYQCWIRVQEISSRGSSKRYPGKKIKRNYHALSLLESRLILYLEFDPRVLDIREQFPLLPIEDTLYVAEWLGIKHPTINLKP